MAETGTKKSKGVGQYVVMTARCSVCKSTRMIVGGSPESKHIPLCEKDGMPMMPVKCEVKNMRKDGGK